MLQSGAVAIDPTCNGGAHTWIRISVHFNYNSNAKYKYHTCIQIIIGQSPKGEKEKGRFE